MVLFFIKVLNMSIKASWLLVAIILFRVLLGHKINKWFFCLLWVLACLRLIVPFSFESRISLQPGIELSEEK